jgi:hypothetical protein
LLSPKKFDHYPTRHRYVLEQRPGYYINNVLTRWIEHSVEKIYKGRMVQQDYTGRVRGDTIDGTVTLGNGNKSTILKWRAKRVKQGLPAGFAADGEHNQ